MSWRVAKSLDVLLGQINDAAPRRSKVSDGSIGDADHQNRNSDHNPWVGPGVVTARDFTHDPKSGADMRAWSEAVKDDHRVKYVIFNRRIYNPSVSRTWRAYSGSNPHTLHMHVSVRTEQSHYDGTARWPTPAGVSTQSQEGFLVALTDEQQKQLYDSVMRTKTAVGEMHPQVAEVHRQLTDREAHTVARKAFTMSTAFGTFLKGGAEVNVDVDELAAALSETLGDDVAQAVGRKLVG